MVWVGTSIIKILLMYLLKHTRLAFVSLAKLQQPSYHSLSKITNVAKAGHYYAERYTLEHSNSVSNSVTHTLNILLKGWILKFMSVLISWGFVYNQISNKYWTGTTHIRTYSCKASWRKLPKSQKFEVRRQDTAYY